MTLIFISAFFWQGCLAVFAAKHFSGARIITQTLTMLLKNCEQSFNKVIFEGQNDDFCAKNNLDARILHKAPCYKRRR